MVEIYKIKKIKIIRFSMSVRAYIKKIYNNPKIDTKLDNINLRG